MVEKGPHSIIGPLAPQRARPVARSVSRQRMRWLALLAGTLMALYLCWLIVRPFVSVILWATVLVIVFYPLHHRILERTKSASLSALASCLIAAITIVAPITFVTIAVVNEAGGAIDYLPVVAKRLFAPDSFLQRWFGRYFDFNTLRSETFWSERLHEFSGMIASQTLELAGSVIGALVKSLLVAFTMYYLFRDADRIKKALREMLPLEPAQTDQIFSRTGEVIRASVDGVLLIAAIQATLGLFSFWVLSLPSPLLWAAAMLIAAMIPAGGTFAVSIPAVLYFVAQQKWWQAIVLAAWCVGVIAMLDNVLRPRLVGGRTRLHELIIFFSALGGIVVFGPLGLVVGPVVVAITLALLDVFRKAERPITITAREPTLAEEQANLRNVDERDEPPAAERPQHAEASSVA